MASDRERAINEAHPRRRLAQVFHYGKFLFLTVVTALVVVVAESERSTEITMFAGIMVLGWFVVLGFLIWMRRRREI